MSAKTKSFSKESVFLGNCNIFLRGEELSLVTEFICLRVILDLMLSYKNMRGKKGQISATVTGVAAKVFVHPMLCSCIDCWVHNLVIGEKNIIKPIEPLY